MKLEVNFEEKITLMAALDEYVKTAKKFKASLDPVYSNLIARVTDNINNAENMLKRVEKLR